MKIREVRVQNFRNFGPDLRTISFVDPLTQQVRPLSVLVGSNGSGKTTVLELIEQLVCFAAFIEGDRTLLKKLRVDGYADTTVEIEAPANWAVPRTLRIACGRDDRTTVHESEMGHICAIQRGEKETDNLFRSIGRDELRKWRVAMEKGRQSLQGGLLYFPHRRWIEHEQRAAIEEPPKEKPWIFRFDPDASWEGSLSQLWVWLNYLDLEQAREGRPNLTPFVAGIENILGPGRRVVIKQGRVTVEHPTLGRVELHQLPSGEQQILTLFGEILRRMRPGAVLMIDEVEISLHPALQRAVLFHLRELARTYDLQIILTTHSMEIVSAVAPEEVIDLDEMVLAERARAQGTAT